MMVEMLYTTFIMLLNLSTKSSVCIVRYVYDKENIICNMHTYMRCIAPCFSILYNFLFTLYYCSYSIPNYQQSFINGKKCDWGKHTCTQKMLGILVYRFAIASNMYENIFLFFFLQIALQSLQMVKFPLVIESATTRTKQNNEVKKLMLEIGMLSSIPQFTIHRCITLNLFLQSRGTRQRMYRIMCAHYDWMHTHFNPFALQDCKKE